MNETCSNCKFWKFGGLVKTPGGLTVRAGICRRQPPFILVPIKDGAQVVSPQTAGTDWCGEYQLNLKDDSEVPAPRG